MSKYFYDKQLRRYLLQVARIFSGYQVMDGYEDIAGQRVRKYKTVPVAHANINRLGAAYLTNNSENVINHAPSMAFYISDLQPLAEFRNPQHYTNTTRFTEKAKSDTGDYVNIEGKKYEVAQIAPTPLDMKITLDIWTSSTEQKMEIIEQMLVYFNPGFQFRVNSSRFDMGQLSNIELESIQWSSKGVPIGSSTELEFSTLSFRVFPVFISAPAKITRQNIIKTIAVGTNTVSDLNTMDDIFAQHPDTHMYVTPSGYNLSITKEKVNGSSVHVARLYTLDSDELYSWDDLYDMYGVDADSKCLIRIRQSSDIEYDENDVYAFTHVLENDRTSAILEYDTDTFKVNTLPPINMIISGSNENTDTFNSEDGTRVLIVSDMVSSNPVWGFDLPANTILEKTNGVWVVAFNPTNHASEEYLIHATKKEQYKFVPELKEWIPTMIGNYSEGFWSFDIQKVKKL